MAISLSSYAANFPSDGKDQKISVINNVNPFLGAFSGAEAMSDLPLVGVSDLSF